MITFRAIEEEDLKLMKDWRNSSNVFPYVREYRLLSDYDQDKWWEAYQKSRRTSEWDQELMIIEEESIIDEPDKQPYLKKYPIGVSGFTRIQWKNRKSEVSFYCDKDFIKESLLELLKIGFNRFGFHKITWPVYGHDPCLPIYKTILNEEAVLKEEYFWNGKFYDRHYLSLTEEEYKDLTKSDKL